jgi:O-antigen/teichoic acid export membrane protein
MTLRDKTIRAFLWVSSTKVVSQVFTWVVTIVLARLLLPADFGLIALASFFIHFLEFINDLGVAKAIIQKKDLDEDDLHSTFWLSILLGLILYLFIFFSAPVIGGFFNSEKLPVVLRVLGINFLIFTLNIIPYNLLAKELAFKKRTSAELVSVITGGIVSITLAVSGYGVWSLVWGSLLQHLVLTVLIIYFCPWKPRFVFVLSKAKQVLNFGIPVACSRVLWYFYTNSDYLMVGKMLGDKSLGHYSMAFRLSTLPVHKITSVIDKVSFPVFSRLQDDKKNLRRYFLKMTKFVSLITFPLLVGLFWISESLIKVVLTEKWMPMLIPFKILCVIGLLKSVSASVPMLLQAMGKPYIVMRFNMICFMILPVSFLIGTHFGINGVAWAWVVAYPCLLIYLYRHGLGELGLTFSEYLKNLLPSIAASTFMGLTVFLFQMGGQAFYHENAYFELIGSCIIGGISYSAYLLFFHREIMTEFLGIFDSLRRKKLKEQVVIQ